MNPKTFRKAALYLMNLKVGDGYPNQDGNFVMCVKHSNKKVVFSNGQTFRYKTKNNNRYLVGELTGMFGLFFFHFTVLHKLFNNFLQFHRII